MALINCTECGKQISDRSVACIYCGCPMSEIKKDFERIKQQQAEEARKQIEAERRAYEERKRIERERQEQEERERRERWAQAKKLNEERHRAALEAQLKYKRETQHHIDWNHILTPLHVYNSETCKGYDISYHRALVEDGDAVRYLEEDYYVVPEIHKYIEENTLLKNRWDFLFDVFNKREEYGFKITWNYLIKSVRDGYFVFQSYKKSKNEFIFVHAPHTLRFIFKPNSDSYFCLNETMLNLSVEKQKTILEELSPECFEQYNKIMDLRKKCKEIDENKQLSKIQPTISEAKTGELKTSINNSRIDADKQNENDIPDYKKSEFLLPVPENPYDPQVKRLAYYLQSGETLMFPYGKHSIIEVELMCDSTISSKHKFGVSPSDRVHIYWDKGNISIFIHGNNVVNIYRSHYRAGSSGKIHIDNTVYNIPCRIRLYEGTDKIVLEPSFLEGNMNSIISIIIRMFESQLDEIWGEIFNFNQKKRRLKNDKLDTLTSESNYCKNCGKIILDKWNRYCPICDPFNS